VAARAAPSLRARFGLVTPTEVYPLYENAGRAAYGQTLDEAQAETAEIWQHFSEVAAANEGAWLRKPVSAAQIRTPSADNRPLAHPYLKLMVANSSVNQGAGFIVTSLARARAHGIPDDRLIHVGHGAAAHEPEDFLTRDRYDDSPGMVASLTGAMAMNGATADDLDFVELYSCYPCVPKMARRVLGWPTEKPASVFGGLTFGGGPIGNYMSHAVVSLVHRLRAQQGRGLLFANGGFASHNHTILLSSTPTGKSFPQDFDVQSKADSARGPIPPLLEGGYAGPATIETYTVLYARDGSPRFGVILGRTPAGERFLAKVPPTDAGTIAFLTDGRHEPVGSHGAAVRGADGDPMWIR
jgi:acetyl-CoA C-acetyltransferase